MSEPKTADQKLQEIADMVKIPVQQLTALFIESQKDDIRFKERLAAQFDKQTKATEKEIAYIKVRNEELQARLLNFELEPKFAEIIQKLNTGNKPKLEVVQK